MRMFISEDLAVTSCVDNESLLRYTIEPSVLSMDIVGTFTITCQHAHTHTHARTSEQLKTH